MTQTKGNIFSKAPYNDDLFEGDAHRMLVDEIRNDESVLLMLNKWQ